MILSDLRDRFNGRIFLLGNGPSMSLLTVRQKAKLNQEHLFVGSRFCDWHDSGLSPHFYVLTERKQTTEWMDSGKWQQAHASIARFWVTWQPAPPDWVPVPRPPSNAHDVLNYGLLGGLFGRCNDGIDLGIVHLHHGKDTPLAMAQLAAYMGFTEMYLLGCETTNRGEVYQPDRQRNSHAPGIMNGYYKRAATEVRLTDCTLGPVHTLSQDGGPLSHVPLKEVL